MLLEVASLNAFYGDLQALHDVNVHRRARRKRRPGWSKRRRKNHFHEVLAGLIEHKRGSITFGGREISACRPRPSRGAASR